MSNVNESLDSMMSDIKVHLSDVIKVLESKNFINSCIDKLKDLNPGENNLEIVFNEDKSLDVVGKKPSNTFGIYMFWADFSSWKKEPVDSLKDLLNEFSGVWDKKDNWGISKDSKAYGKFPKAIGKRIKKLFNPKDNNEQVVIDAIPFYLGKSEKLADRIKDHFNLEVTSTTYALKLKARTDFLTGIKFKVAWLPFKVTDGEYFIVDKIESLLRKELNPIIGKQ